MPGTTTHSDSNDYELLPDELEGSVDASVDLSITVWLPSYEGSECYHRDCAWGCACPEHMTSAEKATLREAVERGLRPCSNCNPVDYRRVATDGGEDSHAGVVAEQLRQAEKDGFDVDSLGEPDDEDEGEEGDR